MASDPRTDGFVGTNGVEETQWVVGGIDAALTFTEKRGRCGMDV